MQILLKRRYYRGKLTSIVNLIEAAHALKDEIEEIIEVNGELGMDVCVTKVLIGELLFVDNPHYEEQDAPQSVTRWLYK